MYERHVCHLALAFAYAVRLRTICAPGCPLTANWGASSRSQRPSVGAIDAPCCPLSGPGIKKNPVKGFFVPFLGAGRETRQAEEVSCWVDAQKLCEPRPDVGAGADEGRTLRRGSGYERKVEAATKGVLEGEAIAAEREAPFHRFDVRKATTRSTAVGTRREDSERKVCGAAAGNDGGSSFRGAATHLGVGGGIGGVSGK